MRRLRGPDKPLGPSPTPSPTNRSSNNGPSIGSAPYTKHAISKKPSTPTDALTLPDDAFLVRGSGSIPASFIDPRTKQPVMIPPAGRTVPKLDINDLTTSLAPLVESNMISANSPMSKRINATMREISSNKDLLESFDDAIRIPDMKTVNTKMAQLRRSAILPPNIQSPRIAGASGITPPKTTSGVKKKGPKVEEKNLKKLMGQLRDKYLVDMESQLGLAVDRRSFGDMGSSIVGDNISGDSNLSGMLPRPSTNAAEITTRIDKVVREWSYEAQQLSKNVKSIQGKVPLVNPANKVGSFPTTSAKNPGGRGTKALAVPTAVVAKPNVSVGESPGKNKHLAKISTAFKKNLDKYIAKKDVRELINIPEDGHVEKMEAELAERRKAHEAVFRNAITLEPTISVEEVEKDVNNNSLVDQAPTTANKKRELKRIDFTKKNDAKVNQAAEGKVNVEEPRKNVKKNFVESINMANDDQDEVYTIIKDHMEYEMAGGPPKLTQPKSSTIMRKPSRTALTRPDPVGRVLMKYESHKKLQNLVDSFSEKIDPSKDKRPGPSARMSDIIEKGKDEKTNNDAQSLGPNSSIVNSQSTLDSRKKTSFEISGTLSRSMRTIDKASSVAQRLGTLMSRVALRNEAYEREKEQEEMEKRRLMEEAHHQKETSRAVGTDINNNPILPPPEAPGTNYAIKLASTPSALQANSYKNSPNPYESLDNVVPSRRKSLVPPGVSKLDSAQFGKYVEQMKIVAEKAAESFEKFKERQEKNDSDIHSFSEGEEEGMSDEEGYNYQTNPEAYAVAAAAAEIAKRQEEAAKMNAREITGIQRPSGKTLSTSTKISTKLAKATEAGTSPREMGKMMRDKYQIGISSRPEHEFKFVPDMSYTDQLMLQKLRKLKEKEGWGDSLSLKVSELMDETEKLMGDAPSQNEIETMVKKATNTDLTKDMEKGGMGPVLSLNAVLRARQQANNKNKTATTTPSNNNPTNYVRMTK